MNQELYGAADTAVCRTTYSTVKFQATSELHVNNAHCYFQKLYKNI